MVGPKPAELSSEDAAGTLDTGLFTGRFTLIVGDVNRGKTRLARRILEAFCRDFAGPFTIVDLAPDLGRFICLDRFRGVAPGGALIGPAACRIHYHRVRLAAPRLQARDEAEQERLAEENRRRIDQILKAAYVEPVKVLFINDCSIYLQAGPVNRLLDAIRAAETSVVNGYFGSALGPGRLSVREQAAMAELIGHCDQVIRL